MERATIRLATPARKAGNPFSRLLRLFLRLDRAYRDQRAFERLDAHLLRDIGLTDHAARGWDAPEVMRRK